jgi:hypothetical protein
VIGTGALAGETLHAAQLGRVDAYRPPSPMGSMAVRTAGDVYIPHPEPYQQLPPYARLALSTNLLSALPLAHTVLTQAYLCRLSRHGRERA